MHTTTYNLCMKLIAIGKTDGLMEKVDVYYLANRLTEDEYKELASILNPSEPDTAADTENAETFFAF